MRLTDFPAGTRATRERAPFRPRWTVGKRTSWSTALENTAAAWPTAAPSCKLQPIFRPRHASLPISCLSLPTARPNSITSWRWRLPLSRALPAKPGDQLRPDQAAEHQHRQCGEGYPNTEGKYPDRRCVFVTRVPIEEREREGEQVANLPPRGGVTGAVVAGQRCEPDNRRYGQCDQTGA